MRRHWPVVRLGEVAAVNPERPSLLRKAPDSLQVTFVPMAAIDEVTGTIGTAETRPLSAVRKGFTPFQENDVLFAKITPCMQNGKSAIARDLRGGIGFGSTEFHVLRPSAKVLPEWIWYFVRQVSFREEARRHFRGSAGQQRVPAEFLAQHELPLPPLEEQDRIIERLRKCMNGIHELHDLRTESEAMAASLLPAYLNEISKAAKGASALLGSLLEETQNGRSIRAEGETGNGSVLTLSAVRSLSLDMTARKSVSFDNAVARKYQVRSGDVFVSRSNTRDLVGLSAIADTRPAQRMIFPDLLIRLTPILEMIRPRYLAYALRFPDVRRQIQDRATGSSQTMVKISGERLREVQIPLPAVDLQDSLVDKLDEASRACASLKSALVQGEFDHLRTALFRKAFAGEL